ncbi:MAG: helix-turn-helix domain-containing protein [Thiotrichaceae bacterium]
MNNHTSLAENQASLLSDTVSNVSSDYLISLGDQDPTNLYRQIIDEVEKPLLEVIMERTHGNQSRAAICLGINRATLRSKLKRHGLM